MAKQKKSGGETRRLLFQGAVAAAFDVGQLVALAAGTSDQHSFTRDHGAIERIFPAA
ncbi:Uncharacterised protein [Cedecea lapagei]|uniref:Uncharacterized protein n=1 Tax=Cedecea lapagei TaxID=158823 RepID=A0A447V6Z7_9ENTR|nr:Uncharacterised protein [Cedecea lapagei]